MSKITLEARDKDDSIWTGKKHVKAYGIELGCVYVAERTITASKAEATRQVEQILDGFCAPLIASQDGWTLVVDCRPNPGGADGITYSYTIVEPSADHRSYGGNYEPSMADAERRGRNHLAQNACDYHNDESVARWASFLSDEKNEHGVSPRVDHLRMAAWQRAARHAQERGVEDVHRWACDHNREFYASVGLVENGWEIA